MVEIPDIILKKFNAFADIACWGFCNEEKVPVQKLNPELRTSWKKNPELGVITLPELIEFAPNHVGFGIFTGDGLGCLDFDKFLKDEKLRFNNMMDAFFTEHPTFVEYSSSNTGTHAFYFYPKDNPNVKEFGLDIAQFGIKDLDPEEERLLKLPKDDPERKEKGLTDYMPDGKFYPQKHFIKLTGRVYRDYTYELYTIKNYDAFEKILSKNVVIPRLKSNPYQTSLLGDYRDWNDILAEGGIPHIPATSYIGKVSPKSGKLVITAFKIPCPNRSAHATHREGDISAELALLCKFNDGSSSCTCNHNSCDPQKKPNLLQKLWDEINGPKINAGKKRLNDLGVVLNG